MRSSGGPLRAPNIKVIDRYLAIPLAGCAYALIIYPLLISLCNPGDVACTHAPRPENRIIWPLLSAVALYFAVRNWSRLVVPPHIICLFAYLAFAGLSVVWAFSSELSAVRYLQQVMVVSSIVLPALIMTGRTDLVRGLFLCFALAMFINIFYVLGPPTKYTAEATLGHSGYFAGKNYLGQCAAITVLLALHEILHPGRRRALGIAVMVVAVTLLLMSNSKTSIAAAFLAPTLALIAVTAKRKLRLSVLALPVAILLVSLVMLYVLNFSIYRLSYVLYGEPTFTGRRTIWEFAQYEIGRRPLYGWGYQSFWLAGPGAPSVVDAPGWVKNMPNAHNGYLDAALEMGYGGLALLLLFLSATLHASGRLIDRDPARGWCMITLASFVIINNLLESTWFRAFEFLWVLFLIVSAEIARFCYPYAPGQSLQTAGAGQRAIIRSRRPMQRAPASRAVPQRTLLAGPPKT